MAINSVLDAEGRTSAFEIVRQIFLALEVPYGSTKHNLLWKENAVFIVILFGVKPD